MEELVTILGQLFHVLGRLGVELLALGMRWSLLLFWVAWWLWGVNWKKTWGYLAAGAWVPLLLLTVISAMVWAAIAPGDCNCLAVGKVPNFWWQLGAVGLLVASALFSGWLQGVLGWTPAEIDLDPPGPSHDHGHGHH